MKINIYYFSGTGNTAWVANLLTKKLVSLGNDVVTISCERAGCLKDNLELCDIVGIIFPIHSSFAPALFQDFLRQFPNAKEKPMFAIATAGYIAGDVTEYTSKILEIKGYQPFLLSNITMGNNLHLPILCPLPVTSKSKMKHKLKKAECKINKLAELINQQRVYMEGANIQGELFGIIQRFIAKKFEPHVFKGFFTDENCTNCGWCIKNCPVSNIGSKDGKVKFLGKCMICMRCYNFCPNKAIQFTDATKNLKKYVRYQGPEGRVNNTVYR